MKLEKLQPVSIEHNVAINVIDERTGRLVQHHEGHNVATNSLLIDVGKYLTGMGVFNQGKDMLANYIPQYISLGTLGLHSQDQDSEGLPTGIGPDDSSMTEAERYTEYMIQGPGYGADGYSNLLNNARTEFGLGLPFTNYSNTVVYSVGDTCMYGGVQYRCIQNAYGQWNPACWERIDVGRHPHFGELITPTFPRAKISYREVIPERYAELPCTIDVVFSAMISTGALRQFRYGTNDYIFITEAGLWSRPNWENNGANGLVAGYRIAPPNKENWDMTEASNRRILQQNIIRVGMNQVVQVIWKIQLGSIEQFGGLADYYHEYYNIQWEYGLNV